MYKYLLRVKEMETMVHSARIRDNTPKLKHRRLLLNFLKYFCCESGCTGWPESFFVQAQNPAPLLKNLLQLTLL